MTRAHRPAELIRRTGKALVALYEAEGARLTLAQFEVITVLKAGNQTGPELVKLTGIDRATLYALMPRMRAAGMVWGVPGDPAGFGPVPTIWAATADGRRAWKETEKALWRAEKALLSALGLRERGAFLTALERTAFVRPAR